MLITIRNLIRIISSKSVGRKDVTKRDRNLIISLGPKGLVAAVLASLPMQKAATGVGDMVSAEAIQNVSYAVVLISILLCSVLVFMIEKTKKSGQQDEPEDLSDENKNAQDPES